MKITLSLLIILFGFISCNKIKTNNSIKICYKGNFSSIKPKSTINKLDIPQSENTLVLRTDFSNDQQWSSICSLISNSGKEKGFQPYVSFLSDIKFNKLNNKRLLNISRPHKHHFIFLIDSITINHHEHPIRCIDLSDKPGQYFRTIPNEMWAIENNLSIANMGFDEFFNASGTEGIYRNID